MFIVADLVSLNNNNTIDLICSISVEHYVALLKVVISIAAELRNNPLQRFRTCAALLCKTTN